MFATVLFAAHALLEVGVGARVLSSGFYPHEDAAARSAKPARLRSSARFHGGGLIALGLLTALVLLRSDPTSDAGQIASWVCLVFHGLGAAGMWIPVVQGESRAADVARDGAFLTHTLFALGFAVLA